MCGIFGIIRPAGVPEQWVETLGNLNAVRGNLAFGGLIWSPDSGQVFRFARAFEPSQIKATCATIVLGHIRAPSGGRSNDLREVHPFETAELLLAHNGILLNHANFPFWRLDADLQVDSHVIVGGIQHYLQVGQSIQTAIVQTVEHLEGQQGCWLWRKSSPGLYLWRVMSSLYYRLEPGCFVFSSVKCELANQLLPEGLVYHIDPGAQALSPLAQFRFYSPYKVVG